MAINTTSGGVLLCLDEDLGVTVEQASCPGRRWLDDADEGHVGAIHPTILQGLERNRFHAVMVG
ncbi:MAG: hypothetical protein JF570_08160 [Caulobacter sp.]|nr:hypothetical protein [Caulobacter sp.]